jgi:lipid A ethanolaminephosphotransferase
MMQPLVVTMAFFLFTFATSFNWLWIDHNAPKLSGLVLPWSYVVHTTKYVRDRIRMNREQDLLPDGRLTDLPQGVSREVVLLVIGESERAANNAYYGYQRETNPYTKNLGIIAVSDARSCATYTLAGLACMLTADGSEASVSTNEEPLGSYLSRIGVDVIWRTNSSGEPRQKVNEYIRLNDLAKDCSKEYCDALPFELALLSGLETRVKESKSRRIFIVMHLGRGSHGPSYNKQVPPGFAIFDPVCETVQVRECSYQELVNAYDNTVAYTDYFLAKMIAFLGELGDVDATMIYVSDHGESLGENGVYLHGVPNVVAPSVQRDIPLLVWMSDGFAERRGVTDASIQATLAHGHDNIFHSVIGAFGVKTPVYRPEYDLFAARPVE